MPQVDRPMNILELLDGIALPATKVELIDYAENQGASEDALDLIQAMPDRDYTSFRQINAGLGLMEDLPGTDNGFWPGSDNANGPRDPKTSTNSSFITQQTSTDQGRTS